MAMAAVIRAMLLAALLTCAPAAEYVIAYDTGQRPAISDSEIRAMFVGRRTTWPDGRSVMVAAATTGPGHDGLMRLLGKTSQQFLNGWKKLMFTGNGTMPKLLAGDQEVVAYVAQTPGAIGFIASPPPASGVVVILQIETAAGD